MATDGRPIPVKPISLTPGAPKPSSPDPILSNKPGRRDILGGVDRIGSDRLERIAKAIDVAPSFFTQPPAGQRSGDPDPDALAAFVATPEGRTLVSRFMRIADPVVRARVLALVLGIGAGRPPHAASAPD